MSRRKTPVSGAIAARFSGPWLLVAALLPGIAMAADERLYFIGNSLTNGIRLDGLQATAAANGHELEIGYHIRGNTSLGRLAEFPDETGVTAFPACWNQALAAQGYDRVMLQPYPTDGSTLGSDLAALRTILAAATGAPTAYIYAPWPRQSLFFDIWERPGPVVDETRTFLGQAYFTTLVERARDDESLAGTQFFMIPAGEVIVTLNAKMVAGEVPGFSSYTDLYGDEYHLNSAGAFVAAMTVYATLVGDPRGIAYDATAYTDPRLAQAAPIFQQAVWDVVTTNQYTGVSVPEPSCTVVAAGIAAAGWAYWLRCRRVGRAIQRS